MPDDPKNPSPAYWRYAQAASYLSLPVATVRSLVCRGQIPHHRLSGRLVMFSQADLDAWLAAHRVAVAAK